MNLKEMQKYANALSEIRVKCIEKGPQENCSPLPRKNEKQLSIFDLEVMSRGN